MSRLTALLIDDDPNVHDLIDFHLEGVVDRIFHAEHPASGIALATHEMPDVILLDIEMPYMDGFQVCRELKQLALTRDIPIIFLTADNATHHVARGLDMGGTDYVTKPFVAVELQARVRAALRTRRLIELLRVHARVDALTGLKNRGALEEALERSAAEVARRGGGYAVALLDVDHFKVVNDTYGHGIGDEVLRQLGATIGGLCRPTDLAARYGGEEFALVLADTNQATAITICERLLNAIRKIRVSAPAGEFGFTISAGLAMAGGNCPTDDALQRADEALYHAKGLGRDRLVIWTMASADDLVS